MFPNRGVLICAVYDYVDRENLSKGYRNPHENCLGVTKHFLEVRNDVCSFNFLPTNELHFGHKKKNSYSLDAVTLRYSENA